MSNQHEPNKTSVETKQVPVTPFNRMEDQVTATRRNHRELEDAVNRAVDEQTGRTQRK
jgi:hypothetical protein